MRVSGYSFRKIAAELGIREAQAHRDVMAVLARITERTNESVDEYIELELTRLDAILQSMSGKMAEGDQSAAAIFLKACESRRKLLGLDKQRENDFKALVAEMGKLSNAELLALAGVHTADAAAGGAEADS